MPYTNSTYRGDDEFPLECTGDVCVGDSVRFERATFTGSFRSAKFAGFEQVTGVVIRDSYGAAKQQHTFTLRLETGEELLIKGRNLYKNGCFRKMWKNESDRAAVLDEKHNRGNAARQDRAFRIETGIY